MKNALILIFCMLGMFAMGFMGGKAYVERQLEGDGWSYRNDGRWVTVVDKAYLTAIENRDRLQERLINGLRGLGSQLVTLAALGPLLPGSALLSMYWMTREPALVLLLPPAAMLPPNFDIAPMVNWGAAYGMAHSARAEIRFAGASTYIQRTSIVLQGDCLHDVTIRDFTLNGGGSAVQWIDEPPTQRPELPEEVF